MMNDHTAKAFDVDLHEITRLVSQMGGLAEKQVADSIDLLVTDVVMPQLNGWAATAELKQSPLTQAIPIIIVSAVPTTPGEARAAGCDGILQKPCLPELLWLEIQLLLYPESAGEPH